MKALYLRFHRWRGFGPGVQGDFFSVSRSFGFATFYVCKECLVERLQRLKALANSADPEQRRRDADGQ